MHIRLAFVNGQRLRKLREIKRALVDWLFAVSNNVRTQNFAPYKFGQWKLCLHRYSIFEPTRTKVSSQEPAFHCTTSEFIA